MQRRALILRIVSYWFAFGLGSIVGGFIVAREFGSCTATVVDLDPAQLVQAVQSALPAATLGSGTVDFSLAVTGIHIHASSAFKGQDFDTTIPAVVKGSPATIEVSSRLLMRMVSR